MREFQKLTARLAGVVGGCVLLTACPSQQAVKPDPSLSELQPTPTPAPELTAEERVAEAKTALDAGRYDDAIQSLHKALEKDAANAEAHFLLGTIHERQSRIDEAIAAYKSAVEANGAHEPSLLNLGALYRQREQFDDAIALYTKALEADPENVRLRNNLGVIYRLAKKYDEAEKTLRRVLARSPGNVDAYKNMAVLFLDQDKLVLAEQFSIEARKLDDKDAGIWNNLGLIYFKRDEGRPTRALAAFRKAVELDPNNAAALMNVGAIALRYRDYDTARTTFEKVVQLDPNSFQAHLAYAYALDGGRKYPEALAAYDKATSLRGAELPDVVYSKCVLFKNQQDWKKALDTCTRFKAMGEAGGAEFPAARLATAEEIIKSADYMVGLANRQTEPAPQIGSPEQPAPAPQQERAPEAPSEVTTAPATEPAEAVPAAAPATGTAPETGAAEASEPASDATASVEQ